MSAPIDPAQVEAEAGWAVIDRRLLRWHDRECGVKTFKANRPECDCGLQAAIEQERARLVTGVGGMKEPRLEPFADAAARWYSEGWNRAWRDVLALIRDTEGGTE